MADLHTAVNSPASHVVNTPLPPRNPRANSTINVHTLADHTRHITRAQSAPDTRKPRRVI